MAIRKVKNDVLTANKEEVKILNDLGVLKPYGTDERFTITDSYLEGFNKKRRGLVPSTKE